MLARVDAVDQPAAKVMVALELAYATLAERALRALTTSNIPVMPLKGILFACWLYENPGQRLGGDIDLLVPEEHFDRAIEALAKAAFEPRFTYSNGRECTLNQPNSTIEIDLHRGLFAIGRYRMTTADLFARSRPDGTLFGVPVLTPDPVDAFAHVVGHAAADHVPSLPLRAKEDLLRLVARFRLEPGVCAARLDDHGLARAARYTLGFLVNDWGFAGEVLRLLTPDPLGDVLNRVAKVLTLRFPVQSFSSRLAGYLVNSSVPRSVFAGSVATLNRLRMGLGLRPH